MPVITFEIPDPKPSDDAHIFRPYMSVPINKDMLPHVKVDSRVRMVIRGKIKAIRNTEGPATHGTYQIEVEMEEVNLDTRNVYSDLVEED